MGILHEIKQNDTRPYFAVTLKYEDGSVVDLTSATVRFIAKDTSDSSVAIDAAATLTDAANGQVEYRFTTGDTDTAGKFNVEWEVTFVDATVQTFPTRGYDRLKIYGELA